MAKKKYYNNSMRSEKSVFLKEDYNSVANLPQNVIYTSFPSDSGDYRTYDLDDTLRSVDNQMRADSKGGKKGNMPSMY